MSRKPTSWKRRMFKRVAQRDGLACAECRAPEQKIWRKGGISGRFDWGNYYQVVHLTSNLELDHKLPFHLGGDNEPGNLWPLCRTCHQDKISAEQSSRLKALGAGRNA